MTDRRRPFTRTLRQRRGCLAGAVLLIAVSGCNRVATSGTDSTIGSVPVDRTTPNGEVTYILDGDTVVVSFDGTEEHVRLIGIDTPEIAHPERGSTEDCFGDEATDFTAGLLPVGTPVHIERDVEPRDDYGRLLGYVYRAADGIFVNYELVRQGYARPLRYSPNTTYGDLFASAAAQAHDDNLGLWAAC